MTDTVERTTTVEDSPKRERADDDAQGGVDISGPCDEAEHANDPRCTGAPPGRVDNSGPGSVNSGHDDDDGDDDHGGLRDGSDNSGKDSDSSGSGSGGSDDPPKIDDD